MKLKLPLGIDAYERNYANEPIIDLVNRFVETDPTDPTKKNVAILSRPLTKNSIELPQKPLRKLISEQGAFDNDILAVIQDSLYRYKHKKKEWIYIGSGIRGFPYNIKSDFTDIEHEIITGPGFEYLFISDGTNLWLYDGCKTELQKIKIPDLEIVICGNKVTNNQGIFSIAQINKYLLCSITNSDRFYYILPGEIKIDPLHFYTAEKRSDMILSIRVVGDRIVILGENSIEFWYQEKRADSNIDKFVPYTANALNIGILSGTAIVIQNELFCVGRDGVIYRIDQNAVRISTHPIEEFVRKSIDEKIDKILI